MIKERVKKFICENNLLEKGETVVVAFSGGADSVCLLHLMHSLDISVVGAHLHHGIRGQEADRDAVFAKNFCDKFGIPFYIEYKDIPKLAKAAGISEEEAGRNARYEFFREIKEKTGATKIATAHNKNDNVETILHHIIRGCGTDGLTGISAKRDDIIRPVLFLLREEIEKYCAENSLEFVTDSTNLTQDYTRNKIRLGLIEYLKEFNPNILSSVCLLGENAAVDRDFLNREADTQFARLVNDDDYGIFISIKDLKNLHEAMQRRILILTAKSVDISAEHKHIIMLLEFINEKQTGKRFDLPGGFAEISYDKIYFKSETDKMTDFYYELKNGENEIGDLTIVCENPDNHKLVLRNRLEGDKILVNDMHKKVKKILIDKKIPLHIRNKKGVITVDGEPAAILGVLQGDIIKNNNIKIYCGDSKNGK